MLGRFEAEIGHFMTNGATDAQLGQLARRQSELFLRVKKGTLDIERVLPALQELIEGHLGCLPTPIMHGDAAERLVQTGRYDLTAALRAVNSWHRLAQDYGYSGPFLWRMYSGFGAHTDAEKAGPWDAEYLDFTLKGASLSDHCTQDSYVFWVPRILKLSTGKTRDEQLTLLGDERVRRELPSHHLVSFGSLHLLTSLVFAHFHLTRDCVPLCCKWVRTDTHLIPHAVDGLNEADADEHVRLGGFDGYPIDEWDDRECGLGAELQTDSESPDWLGAFPLGIEPLDS